MVGTVGGILGDAGVNIAGMQVARDAKGGQALVALSVDSAIPADTLLEIEQRHRRRLGARRRPGLRSLPVGIATDHMAVRSASTAAIPSVGTASSRVAEPAGARQATITRPAGRRREPARTTAQAAAIRRTASTSSSAGRVHGIRTNRSRPPSGAKTGPGAMITPCRSASSASGGAEAAPGPGARTRARARRSGPGRSTRAAARRPRRPGRRAARAAGPGGRRGSRPGPRAAATSASCSITGAPRSRVTRAWVSRSIWSRGARIQPTRSPPQKALLALPTVIVSGAYAANGRGISCPSRAQLTVGLVDDRR